MLISTYILCGSNLELYDGCPLAKWHSANFGPGRPAEKERERGRKRGRRGVHLTKV
jgi:hypothetical protein